MSESDLYCDTCGGHLVVGDRGTISCTKPIDEGGCGKIFPHAYAVVCPAYRDVATLNARKTQTTSLACDCNKDNDGSNTCPSCGLDRDKMVKTLEDIYSDAVGAKWSDAAAGAHYALRELGHPDYQGEFD